MEISTLQRSFRKYFSSRRFTSKVYIIENTFLVRLRLWMVQWAFKMVVLETLWWVFSINNISWSRFKTPFSLGPKHRACENPLKPRLGRKVLNFSGCVKSEYRIRPDQFCKPNVVCIKTVFLLMESLPIYHIYMTSIIYTSRGAGCTYLYIPYDFIIF